MFFPQLNPCNGLTKAYELTVDIINGEVSVPAGFQFNGASIPRMLWPLIGTPFDPQTMMAALFHDWGYLSHRHSRSVTDKMFRNRLLADGVSTPKSWLMYLAVRLAGGLAWKNGAEETKYLQHMEEQAISRNQDPKIFGL